jgi:hypothetical protein
MKPSNNILANYIVRVIQDLAEANIIKIEVPDETDLFHAVCEVCLNFSILRAIFKSAKDK